jgi:hypothetical protein
MSAARVDDVRDIGRKPALEDLVPLAAVVAAGCQPCAERMVARALEREGAMPFVARTLAILAEVSAAKCFAEAVGPETTERMRRCVRAGRNALDRQPTLRTTCCG